MDAMCDSWYGRHVRQLVWTPCATVGMDAMCDSDEGRLTVAAACAVIEKKKMLDTAMVAKETNVWSIPLPHEGTTVKRPSSPKQFFEDATSI